MRRSKLFTTALKHIPNEERSINSQMLIREGFIDRLMAGVYSFLPLGYRVLTKIEKIIREEMIAIGGQELLLPALQPREIWDKTGRWETVTSYSSLEGLGCGLVNSYGRVTEWLAPRRRSLLLRTSLRA